MLDRALAFALLAAACQRPPVAEPPRPGPNPTASVARGSARQGAAPFSTSGQDEGNRILNLFDAFGPKVAGTRHAFGFSALVRYEGKTIRRLPRHYPKSNAISRADQRSSAGARAVASGRQTSSSWRNTPM